MNHKKVLQEMKDVIGTKEPIVYFEKLTECFSILFDRIDMLEKQNRKTQMLAALAVNWDPFVARQLLSDQIEELKRNKDIYFDAIGKLQQAYISQTVTQDCTDFCNFWKDTLGWHPFTGA